MSSSLPDELEPGIFEQTVAIALAGQRALLARFDALGDDPLAAFLAHVNATVPFYRGRGPLLAEYPLLERDTARAERDRLRSTAVPDHPLLIAKTNGTLSLALLVQFDEASHYELYHFLYARIAASRPGLRESLVAGEPGVYYITDVGVEERLTSYLPALGGVLLRRIGLGRGAAEDAALVAELRAARALVYGKPLTLLRLAELDRRIGGDRIAPLALAISGAHLYPDFRSKLSAWFRCTIIDAYVATESGPIAIDCTHGTRHVLEDRVVLEILEDDGTIAPAGTGELVVTNVMNWAQPFVRYRLGDRCTLAQRACACGTEGLAITELEGREVAAYDVAGVGRVESARLGAILLRPGVKQFEVAEPEPGKLLVRWIPEDAEDAGRLGELLAAALVELLADSYELRRVDRITIDGGKALRFVRVPRFP